MPRTYFDYVDEFDMTTARYDAYGEFHNSYYRAHGIEPGTRTRLSMAGEVRPAYSTYYDNTKPVLHFASGELFLTREISRNPAFRGRYTFAGHDFSVISTSNDPYGAEAIKFMTYMDASDKPRPKLIPASFNSLKHESTKGQDLLIDHVTDRVWGIGAPWDVPKVTEDGVNTAELPADIPDKLNQHSVDAYTKGLGMGFKVQSSIRLSMPRTGSLVPPNYKKNVNACVAWYAHSGVNIKQLAEQEVVGKPKYSYSIPLMMAAVIDPERVAEVGFAGLTSLERACVAVNNTTKSLPRIIMHWHQLRFDSKAFFESFATLVAK